MADIIESLAEAIPPELHEAVKAEFLRGFEMSRINAAAQARQNAIFQQQSENAVRSIDGVGEKIAEIPGDAYYYWQHRLPGCWQDSEFRRDFIRDNPEVAIRNRVKRTVVQGAIFTADGYIT